MIKDLPFLTDSKQRTGYNMEYFSPSATVEFLQQSGIILRQILFACCRLIVVAEKVESKILLGRHVYEDVQSFTAIKCRLEELGSSIDTQVSIYDEIGNDNFKRLVSAATDDIGFFALYNVIKPNLHKTIAEYRACLHPLWDEPSCHLLAECERTLQLQVSEAIPHITEETKQAWASAKPAEVVKTLPENPGRQSLFEIVKSIPRPPMNTPQATLTAALLHYMLMGTEIPTIEHCAALIWDYGTQLSWDFVQDMTRQIWDECRHAQACLDRLEEMGHRLGDFPIEMMLWHMTSERDFPLRLAIHQRIGEWLGLDAAHWWAKRLAAQGDIVTAAMFRFIAQDEHLHVYYGNKWLKSLVDTDEAVIQLHAEAEDIRKEYGAGLNRGAPFPIDVETCIKVGFSPREVEQLVQERNTPISSL